MPGKNVKHINLSPKLQSTESEMPEGSNVYRMNENSKSTTLPEQVLSRVQQHALFEPLSKTYKACHCFRCQGIVTR